MTVRRFPEAGAFCARAMDFLLQQEASHNLMLGLCTALAECPVPACRVPACPGRESPGRERPIPERLRPGREFAAVPSYLATAEAADRVLGAAVRTPPYHLVLSHMPAHAAAWIARDMHVTREPLPGVNGPIVPTETFARAWERLTGQTAAEHRRMRIHQLEAVTPALRAPGRLRRATMEDAPLLVGWFHDFVREALGEGPTPENSRRMEQRIRDGVVYLWISELSASSPVSMASSGGTTPNGIRVSGVYTPPEYRGHGYASACVAALSRLLLESGRRYCFLYTDLANPAADHLYEAIGYHPMCDVVEFSF